MKIKVKKMPYSEVIKIKPPEHERPSAQSPLFRKLLSAASMPELKKTNFSCRRIGMEKLGKNEACLVLMNHSSFIDLKIAAVLLKDRSYHIICTSDAYVGKTWLMKKIGCIPTRKFQMDAALVRDMKYVLKDLNSSILMYPEAGYSFDGTATTIPKSLGKCLKFLGVPVVMIKTYGAFARDPLYNGLRLRKVDVSADVEYLLSPEEIKARSADELNTLLEERFSFDSFRWQQENHVRIDEPFRAEGLNRVLYKCPHCLREDSMQGKGETITCKSCGKGCRLTEYGFLEPLEGEAKFTHVPDWFAWQRLQVRGQLQSGSYKMELPVDIYMLVDTKCVYSVGSGTLVHSSEGFTLTGCGGELEYHQKPSSAYTVNSDYFWYEIADVICIGTDNNLYYCFPRGCGDVVAKLRLAAEELYKMTTQNT